MRLHDVTAKQWQQVRHANQEERDGPDLRAARRRHAGQQAKRGAERTDQHETLPACGDQGRGGVSGEGERGSFRLQGNVVGGLCNCGFQARKLFRADAVVAEHGQ